MRSGTTPSPGPTAPRGGRWDLRGAEEDYLGRQDFDGATVLEIGPANGFLTTEMERRALKGEAEFDFALIARVLEHVRHPIDVLYDVADLARTIIVTEPRFGRLERTDLAAFPPAPDNEIWGAWWHLSSGIVERAFHRRLPARERPPEDVPASLRRRDRRSLGAGAVHLRVPPRLARPLPHH